MYISLKNEDGQIFCRVFDNIKNILDIKEFPLKFKVFPMIGEEIIYECELNSGMWACFNSYRNIKVKIFTKSNILLKEYKYNYENDINHPDYELDEFWDYFARTNKNSIGLILGSGDGSWGEWVNAVNNNKINCHLVEGSLKVFEKLKNNYRKLEYAKLYNSIITTDGKDCKFYEILEDDGLNTVNLDFLKRNSAIDINKLHTDSVIKKTKKLNDFLSEIEQVDWIRFDVEGVDYDLIISMDSNYFSNLKMVQYEHMNLENEKQKTIDNLFLSRGFEKILFKIDTVFIKKY